MMPLNSPSKSVALWWGTCDVCCVQHHSSKLCDKFMRSDVTEYFKPRIHTGDKVKVERTFDIRATQITHFRQSRPNWSSGGARGGGSRGTCPGCKTLCPGSWATVTLTINESTGSELQIILKTSTIRCFQSRWIYREHGRYTIHV